MARRNLLTGLRGEVIAQRSLIAAFIVLVEDGLLGEIFSTPLTGHQALRAMRLMNGMGSRHW